VATILKFTKPTGPRRSGGCDLALDPIALIRAFDLLSKQVALLRPELKTSVVPESLANNTMCSRFETALKRALLTSLTLAEDLEDLLESSRELSQTSERTGSCN
jgi:hypothetical protein